MISVIKVCKKVIKKITSIVMRVVECLLGMRIIERAANSPTSGNISVMRAVTGIQLTTEQILAVVKAVKKRDYVNFLVFGLGYDSIFWSRLNKNGKTIFLENNESWINVMSGRDPRLNILQVSYDTKLKDWREIIESPEKLEMTLSEEIIDTSWDVILVDAPEGWADETPGRMKSIYMGAKLARTGSDVFVDDCKREVEIAYSDRFLPKESFVESIDEGERSLRHYNM